MKVRLLSAKGKRRHGIRPRNRRPYGPLFLKSRPHAIWFLRGLDYLDYLDLDVNGPGRGRGRHDPGAALGVAVCQCGPSVSVYQIYEVSQPR